MVIFCSHRNQSESFALLIRHLLRARLRKRHRLATARSRSGSYSPPGCNSIPSRRFATPAEKALHENPLRGHLERSNTLYCGAETRSANGKAVWIPRRYNVNLTAASYVL